MPVILDPDAAAVYKAFQEAGRPAYETLTRAEARESIGTPASSSTPNRPSWNRYKPLSIPAPHGAIPARIYTPKTAAQDQRSRAVPGVLSRRRLGDRRSRFP